METSGGAGPHLAAPQGAQGGWRSLLLSSLLLVSLWPGPQAGPRAGSWAGTHFACSPLTRAVLFPGTCFSVLGCLGSSAAEAAGRLADTALCVPRSLLH